MPDSRGAKSMMAATGVKSFMVSILLVESIILAPSLIGDRRRQTASARPMAAGYYRRRPDTSTWGGKCGNKPLDPREQQLERARFRSALDEQWPDAAEKEAFVARLARDPVPIRLNMVYDSSLELEHRDKPGGVEFFIRNLVFTTQLIYEQPEISRRLKLNLVTVRVQRTSLEFRNSRGPLSSQAILDAFGNSASVIDTDADLHVLLLFQTLDSGTKIYGTGKTVGLANVGIFCSPSERRTKVLVLSGSSFASAWVMAHELGHSLGVNHDGEKSSEASACNPDQYIMSPTTGPGKMAWSECSVNEMTAHLLLYPSCVYNQLRLQRARPVNERFDFRPGGENANRNLLPGQAVPLDQQCVLFLDRTARSSLMADWTGGGGGGASQYTSCQQSWCLLGQVLEVNIGPAPPGSACKMRGSSTLGFCFNGQCQL